MPTKIYAMRDALTGFMTPVFEVNDQVAIRNFAVAVHSAGSNSALSTHMQHFSLYRIGSYDHASGAITPELPFFLIDAAAAERSIVSPLDSFDKPYTDDGTLDPADYML